MILIDRVLELQDLFCISDLNLEFREFDLLLLLCLVFNVHLQTVKSLKQLRKQYVPLAQLVEQLTLNQWVQGSSP